MSHFVIAIVDGEPRWLAAPRVVAALPLGNLTPVPTAPAAVLGVTQHAGEVLTVVSASPGPREARPGDPLLIVEWHEMRVAILVDRLVGLRETAEGRPIEIDRLLGAVRRLLDEG